MGFNRIVDRDIDARESAHGDARASERRAVDGAPGPLVGGARVAPVRAGVARCSTALCASLSPVALAWVFSTATPSASRAGRTSCSGSACRSRRWAAILAVTGAWSDPWWLLCALSLAVTTWVGGFDILYALQDADFDRTHGLHSIPVAMGERGRDHASRACCTCSSVLLLAAGRASRCAGRSTLASRVGVAIVGARCCSRSTGW